MVHRAAAAFEQRHQPVLTEPSFRRILLGGMPGFLREGFLPLGAFYLGWKLAGLGAGIAASGAASAAVYLYERHAGRDGLLVRLSVAFVAVQTTVGLLSHNTTVYLATPVLANTVWGLAFLGSALARRPLAGTLACAWYPFPPEFRKTPQFRRVYGIESIVWGIYMLARSALRFTVLLHGSIGSFVVITFITGIPTTLALLGWSIWYAIRRLSDDSEDSAGRDPGSTRAPI